MSHTLSELLGAIEPMFSLSIRELEQVSGQPGQDIRLTAEIIGKVHLRTRELGLDPKDTTGPELYEALVQLAKRHDQFLLKVIGAPRPSRVEDVVPRVVELFESLDLPRSVWTLKPASARKLLKKMPPKRLMKQLGYKSVDSMLKREAISELFAGLRLVESQAWLDKFIHSYKYLTASDFELRRLQVIQLDAKRWGAIAPGYVARRHHHLTHLKELGVIAIVPMPMSELPGICLSTLLLLLHYANELRLYSTWFKFHQLRPQFGNILVDTLLHDPNNAAIVAGQHLHWRVVQRYYGRQTHHPEIFEPHIQAEDLLWRQAEDVLYRIEPALKFWQDMDYVGAMQPAGVPVSFNLMDMCVNYCNHLPYSGRVAYHLRTALWNEIFMRYLGQQTIEQQLLKQLDTNNEPLTVLASRWEA